MLKLTFLHADRRQLLRGACLGGVLGLFVGLSLLMNRAGRDHTVRYDSVHVQKPVQLTAYVHEETRRDDLWQKIALAQLDSGDVSGAIETIKGIKDDCEKASVLEAVARLEVHGAGGRIFYPYNAPTLEESPTPVPMDSDESKSWSEARKNDREKKLALLKGALDIANTLRDDDTKASVLTSLGSALARLGDQSAAAETFQRAKQVALMAEQSRGWTVRRVLRAIGDFCWNALTAIVALLMTVGAFLGYLATSWLKAFGDETAKIRARVLDEQRARTNPSSHSERLPG